MFIPYGGNDVSDDCGAAAVIVALLDCLLADAALAPLVLMVPPGGLADPVLLPARGDVLMAPVSVFNAAAAAAATPLPK